MKIIIPTLNKLIDKQLTYHNLSKLKEHIWFVTDKETAKELCVMHNQISIIDKNNITHNDLIEHIIKDRFVDQTIWIVNDNLEFAKYYAMPHEKILMQRKISREPRLVNEFWNTLNLYVKRFDSGGLFSAITPPPAQCWPGIQHGLYLNNFWLNLKKIDLSNLDFKCDCRIDLLIFLTSLKQNNSSALIYEYGIHNNKKMVLSDDEIKFISNNFNQYVDIKNENELSLKIPPKTITQNTFSDFFIEEMA
jgi:hypothetical protein